MPKIFDEEQPIGSTRAMRTWYTTKTCLPTQKSQVSHMLADSAWEQHAAGEDSEQNRAKRAAPAAWIEAVNAKGGFGVWSWDVAFQPAQMQDILARHAR